MPRLVNTTVEVLGLRRGECVELDVADVELVDNPAVSIVGKGKTESERLTLAPRPCAAICDWISAPLRGRPVIHEAQSRVRRRLERLTGDSVCRLMARLGDRAR